MGRLIYLSPMSLDGYLAEEGGDLDWSVPSEEVLGCFNDLIRPVGTHLYGRKMYETMVYWETPPPESSPVELEFGELWRDADKVVYSTTLPAISSARTRIERAFDVEAIRALKASADRDITIGGPHLAAHAIRAGIVDDYQLVVMPATLGGGNRVLPAGVRLDLELVDERRFENGTVHLHYRPSPYSITMSTEACATVLPSFGLSKCASTRAGPAGAVAGIVRVTSHAPGIPMSGAL